MKSLGAALTTACPQTEAARMGADRPHLRTFVGVQALTWKRIPFDP